MKELPNATRLLAYPSDTNPRFVIDDVTSDKLPYPYAVLRSGDAATVAIINHNNEVLLNVEYCLPADETLLVPDIEGGHDGMLYKFPGGMQTANEGAEEIARRETEEETGLQPEHLELLGNPHYYVQRALGRDALFIARSHNKGVQQLDENEAGMLKSIWISIDDLQEQVLNQEPKTMNSHFLQMCAYLFAMKNTGKL